MVIETSRLIADVRGEYKMKHATRRKAGEDTGRFIALR
jgi:hypothetical protein